MPSLRSKIVNAFIRRTSKDRLSEAPLDAALIASVRERLDAFGAGATVKPPLSREASTLGGVPVEWTRIPSARGLIYYCHGGGYIVGSPRPYRRFAARMARATGRDVAVIDYRLAPEHPYPAATDDALAGYRALLAAGHRAEDIVIAGDSAGGNLALVTLLRIREADLPHPSAAILLSPWTDLLGTGASIVENANADPMLPSNRIVEVARAYAGVVALDDPWVSPLYADFRGLPPLMLLVGSTEILRDDAVRVAERARAAGVATMLQVWPKMPHVFPVLADVLPEGRRAIGHIAEFARNAGAP